MAVVVLQVCAVLTGVTGSTDEVAPGPATHGVLVDYRNHIFTAAWVLPADADAAVLCYRPGGAPATPAEATTCSPPARWVASLELPSNWTDPPLPRTDFAIFSVSTATGTYGPAAPVTGETPPPYPSEYLTSHGVSSTSLDLTWRESTPADVNGGWPFAGAGGTVEWVVYGSRWSASSGPGLPTRVVAVVPAGEVLSTARVTGLVRDATYRFGVRGRDAEGNLSDWSELVTTAARRPGLSLIHRRGAGAAWRTDRVPARGHVQWDPVALASDRRTGTVHVVWSTYEPDLSADAARSDGARRTTDGRWHHDGVPTLWTQLQHLVVGPEGTRAASAWVGDETCLVSRRPGRRWAVRTCLPPGSWMDGVQVDAGGDLHATYLRDHPGTSPARYYVTNARGRWARHRLSPDSNRLPLPAALAYDRSTDRLVLVGGGYDADVVPVWSKRPRSSKFDTRRSWRLSSPGRDFAAPATFSPDSMAHAVVAGSGRVAVVVCGTGVLVGRATSSSPRTVRVGRQRGCDTAIAALPSGALQLAWTPSLEQLDEDRQGVFTSVIRRTRSGTWSSGDPDRLTRSGFDRLQGVVTDLAGRVTVLIRRDALSPFESGDPYS